MVDCKVEGQSDLFSDSRTTPAGIALLHFNDRMDEFCTRSLRAGLAIVIGGEQHAVFLLAHRLVKAQQGCGLQHKGRPEQASGTQPQRQPAGQDPVPRGQIRRWLPGAIRDQELMLEQKRLGNDGTGTARSEQASQGSDEMDEKDDQIAHHRILAGQEIPTNYGRNNNSPATSSSGADFWETAMAARRTRIREPYFATNTNVSSRWLIDSPFDASWVLG
jgi:hypothetical protein